MDSPRADTGPTLRDSERGFTVGQLCRRIETSVNVAFPDEIWVRGVISGLRRSANGHVYFDLVDPGELGRNPESTLSVALFDSARQRVNAILRKSGATRMEDGVEIRVRGSVGYYPRQGRVQLIMSLIDPAFTLGRLEMAKLQLLAALRAEGLLEANRLLEFPPVPLRIALVTSANSAAEADFVSELASSGLPFEIHLFDTRVQGNEAIEALVRSLDHIARDSADFDIVAVVRGGGSRTDLAVFDHGRVVRAIAVCPLPVIVGIGHEIDSSVADVVAARSAKTPTACAGLLVETVRAFDARLSRLAREISARARWRLAEAHQQHEGHAHRLVRLGDQITQHAGRLELADGRLSSAAHRQLDRRVHQLETADLKVGFLDPAANLARGWAIVHRHDGSLLRSVGDAPESTELAITLADGRLWARSAGAATKDPR